MRLIDVLTPINDGLHIRLGRRLPDAEGRRLGVRDFRFQTGDVCRNCVNPPETGVLDREIKRVKNGKVFLIPASDQTAGHGTTGQARFWKQQLGELLQTAPRAAK